MQGDATEAAAPRRARALELLLEGRTDREVASELRCDPSTVWRWRMDPAFTAELRRIHRERVDALETRIDALTESAVGVISELMGDASLPPMVRLRAAVEILDRAGWTGGAQKRRLQTAVETDVANFYEAIIARCKRETVDEMIKATTEPWPEEEERQPRRPHVVVSFPEEDDK